MQALLSVAVSVYLLVYGFEGPIRYGLNVLGQDELIFARDVVLAVPVVLMFIGQFLRHNVHPAYYAYVFVVGLHGLVMVLNTGSWVAVAYGAKMLLSMLAGALASRLLFQPSRAALLGVFLLWLVTAGGVMADKYYVDFPWTGMRTVIGDIQVDVSHGWESSGEDKRAAGFTRSSINAAALEPLLAFMLIFHLRRRLLRLLVAAVTMPVLYWTTQKGACLAYGLTIGCLLVAPKRPITILRIAFVVAVILMVGMPLILPEFEMPTARGVFSLESLYARIGDTWPHAWKWIRAHDAFPFGVGLGGVGGAQRLYTTDGMELVDNMFVFIYANCGLMACAYLGWLAVTVLGQKHDGSRAVGQVLATLVFLFFYGCVISIIEDQIACLFLGGAATYLAQEVRRHRRLQPGAESDERAGAPCRRGARECGWRCLGAGVKDAMSAGGDKPGQAAGQNNFTLLRLTLALLVVLGHFRILPGLAPARGIFGLADFAVDAFFVISGYLVSGSFDKQPHVGGFYIRRLCRVYPLYLVVLLVQALAMLLLLPGGISEHWVGFLQYLAPNVVFATFMHYDLDGILAGLHKPGINPSLWTLKIEVAFYLILPLLWQLTRRWGVAFLAAVYVASTLYAAVALGFGEDIIARQLPGQLRFFIVGIALYRYRDHVRLPTAAAVAAALGLFWLCTLRHDMRLLLPVYPLCVGLLVFIVALRLPALPLPFDISYGVYLVHGPLIQLSLLLGVLQDTPGFLLGLIGCTVLLAVVADRAIERPGIELGHWLAPPKGRRVAADVSGRTG